MPVQLAADPAKAPMDASVYPWTTRPKYAEVSELLFDYRQSNALRGRQLCPVSDYLAAHLGDDILEVEAYVYGHPVWGPATICESLHRTLIFNNAASGPNGAFTAQWAQHYLALTLARRHPYARARGPLETTLRDPRMRFVSPAAAYVLLAYINAGHPNPRRLLEQPAVRAKFPADLDVAAFAAPDFDGPRAPANASQGDHRPWPR